MAVRGVGARGRGAVIGLVVLLMMASGCQVTTQVDVNAAANGSGTVDVTVTLDKAATLAVGDLKDQLQTADLTAAGWTVTGPVSGTDGSTVIEAAQAFATPAQASTLVAEIAGTGSVDSRPFRLSVVTRRTWWSTRTHLIGAADLTCDLSCFGDSQLQTELGTVTGRDPGPVATQEKDFSFGIAVTLPGKLQDTNAATDSGHELGWTPHLGSRTVLSATTASFNVGHIEDVVGAGVVVLVLLLALLLATFRRRVIRRRRTRRHPPIH